MPSVNGRIRKSDFKSQEEISYKNLKLLCLKYGRSHHKLEAKFGGIIDVVLRRTNNISAAMKGYRLGILVLGLTLTLVPSSATSQN